MHNRPTIDTIFLMTTNCSIYICLNCRIYFSQFQKYLSHNTRFPITINCLTYICLNCRMYFSRFLNIFVPCVTDRHMTPDS